MSVDLSRRVLDWSERNFALNGLDMEGHRHVKADVFDYLNLSMKKGFLFDLVILDPVTFSTSRRGLFRAKKDWIDLIRSSLKILEKGGAVALSCNTRTLEEKDLRDFLEEAGGLENRKIEVKAAGGLPGEYPIHPHLPRMRYLKFLLARCR